MIPTNLIAEYNVVDTCRSPWHSWRTTCSGRHAPRVSKTTNPPRSTLTSRLGKTKGEVVGDRLHHSRNFTQLLMRTRQLSSQVHSTKSDPTSSARHTSLQGDRPSIWNRIDLINPFQVQQTERSVRFPCTKSWKSLALPSAIWDGQAHLFGVKTW